MLQQELKSTQTELTNVTEENVSLKQNISTLETNLTKVSSGPPSDAQLSKTRELEKKLAEEKSRFTDLEKEQEDLLVCMGKVSKR